MFFCCLHVADKVVVQESPQFKARLVHLHAPRVVDFSKHPGLSLQECPSHHVKRGVCVNVELRLCSATTSGPMAQLLSKKSQ